MSLAKEQDSVESIQEDMHLVATTTTENHELVVLLKSPVVKADKKVLILNKIFAGKVGEVTSRFMGDPCTQGTRSVVARDRSGIQRTVQAEQEHYYGGSFQCH